MRWDLSDPVASSYSFGYAFGTFMLIVCLLYSVAILRLTPHRLPVMVASAAWVMTWGTVLHLVAHASVRAYWGLASLTGDIEWADEHRVWLVIPFIVSLVGMAMVVDVLAREAIHRLWWLAPLAITAGSAALFAIVSQWGNG